MKADVSTEMVEKVVHEERKVITLTMTEDEANVVRSVLYLAAFRYDPNASPETRQHVIDLANARNEIRSVLGWPDTLFQVDEDAPSSGPWTVYIKRK